MKSHFDTEYNEVELGQVCRVGDGAHSKVERKESGIPYITSKNIEVGHLDTEDVDYISEEDYRRIFPDNGTVRRPKPGDVLIGIIGSFGNAYRYTESDHFGISSAVGVLRPDESKLDSDFLYYVVTSDTFRAVHESVKGGSVQGYTNTDTIQSLPLVLPPLPVQRRIAGILGALDDKIELNRRMNETLEEMAQILYYRFFDGSVDGDGVRLDELVNIKPRMPVPDDDEVLTYVGMADVEPNRMSVTDYGKKEYTSGRRFINGDTLMARITPSLENGKTAFVDFLSEGEMAFGSTEFTVMRAEEGTSPYFVYCCARDEDFRDYAISTMTGSSGRQRVQENLLGGYAFEDLRQEDMASFHEKAEPLFKLISSNTSENRTLAETRDYLLPKLISGEIEVEAAQEVVEAEM